MEEKENYHLYYLSLCGISGHNWLLKLMTYLRFCLVDDSYAHFSFSYSFAFYPSARV